MEKVQIFRNEEKLEQSDVLKKFSSGLVHSKLFNDNEIEMLAEAYAKNPVDKFIISDVPDVEVAQGDILIWAKGTSMYESEAHRLRNLTETTRMVLQEGDSMTGDHRVVPLENSNLKIKTGFFTPSFLVGKNAWGIRNDYLGLILTSDKPFLIVHREHGNIALPAGEYMICTSMDSTSLNRMLD